MAEPLADRVTQSLDRAAQLYHRLILLLAPCGAGETSALREVHQQTRARLLSINLELSRSMMDLTKRQRALQLPRLLQDMVDSTGDERLKGFFERLEASNSPGKLKNFRYDGTGDVPNHIHSYLSSNFKELRKLSKDDPALRIKSKDRWYLPDPNKAGDLEKLRERTLLRDFWEYLPPGYEPVRAGSVEGFLPGLAPKPAPIPASKRIKVLRLEAVRVGFKHCWQNRAYRTIIAVAQRMPESVLQEDPKLLMWYDQALTRTGESG